MPFCVLDLQIRAHGTLHPPAPVSDPIRAARTCALPLRTCLILPVCALFTVLLVCGCCDHNIYHSTRCMHLHLPGSRSRLAQLVAADFSPIRGMPSSSYPCLLCALIRLGPHVHSACTAVLRRKIVCKISEQASSREAFRCYRSLIRRNLAMCKMA